MKIDEKNKDNDNDNNSESDEIYNSNEIYSEKSRLKNEEENKNNKKENENKNIKKNKIIYIIIFINIFILCIIYVRSINKVNNNINNFNLYNNISNIKYIDINELNITDNIDNVTLIENESDTSEIINIIEENNMIDNNIINESIHQQLNDNVTNTKITSHPKKRKRGKFTKIHIDDNIIKEIKTEQDYLDLCKDKDELEKIHIYYKLCKNNILFDDTTIYKQVENPKISIILTLYNRESYISRVLRSMQNQPMKDIEIIFIDDCSTDKSVNTLEEYQKKDERIILIKHDTNKGTLISRNDGIYRAKGEYIMFADSDDLLIYNILNRTYEVAKKGDYEIVQFAVYRKATRGAYWNYGEIRNNTPIYQPQLSSLMYYYRGYLKQTDWHIWGKLIKREALYRTLESINSSYLNLHMSVNEDGLIDFMLLKKAKSFIYINDYGYLYIINKKSVMYSLDSIFNKAIRDYFIYLKYLFEHTEDNWHEKLMAGEQLKYVYNTFYKKFNQVNENYQLIYDTLNLYIRCNYMKKNNKIRAKRMRRIIRKNRKKFK